MIDADTVIIGAGLTGLSIAQGLHRAGQSPVVLEKSRGTGGRLATKRAGDLRFDHGGQYLNPKGAAFAETLEGLQAQGAADVWNRGGAQSPVMVGAPGMSGVVKPLGVGIEIVRQVRPADLRFADDHWHLRDTAGEDLARCRTLIVTAPAPQTEVLLGDHPLAATVRKAQMAPCWTLMAAFAQAPDLAETCRAVGEDLEWIACDSAKPGRAAGHHAWVVQASADWTRRHLEEDASDIAAQMLEMLRARAGGRLPEVTFSAAHRWRFGVTETALGQPYLHDPDTRLWVAGDWCLGARAEHAAISAGAVLAAMGHGQRVA